MYYGKLICLKHTHTHMHVYDVYTHAHNYMFMKVIKGYQRDESGVKDTC